MRTAIELVRITSNRVKARAKRCKLLSFKVRSYKDNVDRPCAIVTATVKHNPDETAPWASGRVHTVQARLYPPFGPRVPTWITCTCEWHLYSNEVALTLQGSSSIIRSNGKLPDIKNPLRLTMCCKHVAKVLDRAVRDKQVYQTLIAPTRKIIADPKLAKRMPPTDEPVDWSKVQAVDPKMHGLESMQYKTASDMIDAIVNGMSIEETLAWMID